MDERAALQAEIRQLRSALGNSTPPEVAAEARAAVRQMELRTDGLRASIATLQLENRRLQDTVDGLQSQLDAQREALAGAGPAAAKGQPSVAKTQPAAAKAQPAAAKTQPATAKAQPAAAKTQPAAVAKIQPAAAEKPAPQTATSTAKPVWPAPASGPAEADQPATTKVVAGSGWFVNFGSYSRRPMAETWAGRLLPASGTVIIAPGEKDGKHFYRVRVVGLADRDQANSVARQLEADHKVGKLWVGRQ